MNILLSIDYIDINKDLKENTKYTNHTKKILILN